MLRWKGALTAPVHPAEAQRRQFSLAKKLNGPIKVSHFESPVTTRIFPPFLKQSREIKAPTMEAIREQTYYRLHTISAEANGGEILNKDWNDEAKSYNPINLLTFILKTINLKRKTEIASNKAICSPNRTFHIA